MNRLYSIGFIYAILRDIGKPKEPVVSIGFMRQTGSPWKTGKGVQLRVGKYVLQVGLCKTPRQLRKENDDSGLLYAMQGRMMDDKPSEIRNW